MSASAVNSEANEVKVLSLASRGWRRRALVAGVAAAASAGIACAEAQPPKPAQIDRNGVLMLVRSTLLALDQANKTGNYTVLRDLGAPGFQSNTAARLAEIFAKLRNDNLDLAGVAVIEPQLSLLPQIEGNGMMHMVGFFPSAPSQVNFDLSFSPVNGQWRLFAISVGIGSASPAAPQPPVADAKPATPARATETKSSAAPKPAAKPPVGAPSWFTPFDSRHSVTTKPPS
ncbi:hypothetical protein V1291_004994 [Nitrobacteraceae bacterium AZCC 1564]